MDAFKQFSLASMIALLICGPLCVRATAQSGGALMQKMIAAYQRITDYSGQANVDQILELSSGRTLQSQAISVTLRVKRPNKLAMNITNPGPTGTHSIYSNGQTLIVFDALPNHYSTGPTAPNLQAMLPLLDRRAHVDAELDPLYFLSGERLPPTVSVQNTVGSATVNNHPCYVVTGVARTISLPSSKGANAHTRLSGPMHWTWYIDKKTFLLDKIEARSDPILVNVRVPAGNKVVTKKLPVVILIHHTVLSTQTGLPLTDAQFVFKPPSGATIQKPGNALLKGGR